MAQNKKIGVVILNYQTWEDTIKVVRNIEHQQNVDLIFSIVDNNSPNNSYQFLADEFQNKDNFIITKNEQNSGYAKGNNLGLRKLKEYNCDYALIINNDIVISDDNLLFKLSNQYSKLENPGFIAPKQLKLDGNTHLEYHTLPTFQRDILNQFALTRYLISKYANYTCAKLIKQDILKVEIFNGSFLFIDYSLFSSLNFFDEETFLYGEERFWGTKMKLAGKQCYLITTLTFIHAHSQTISKYLSKLNQLERLHESIIEYNKKYRKFPSLKNHIYNICFRYCKLETKIIHKIRSFSK